MSGFEVDPAGIRDFGAKLRKDLDDELWPAGDSITATFQGGVCFGHRTASADVQAAAVEYHKRLDDMVKLMGAFLHNSEVMVQAATDVVRAYEHADATSGSDLQAVLDDASLKVGAAAACAAKARRDAERVAAEAETELLRHEGLV